MTPTEKEKTPPRGIYLLPNLFTTAGLFAGFFAIVAAMNGQFEAAAKAVFIAMIADTLDGRVARLTNTQSAFGMEYDSLSDVVSFGIAPALVVYSWSLIILGKIGWLVAFLYTATTALRLARFNTQAASTDKSYFQGLPCPAAAGVIASLVWIGQEFALSHGIVFSGVMALLTGLLSLAMVSNIRYYSFKSFDLKGKVPFISVIVVVLLYIAIAINPPSLLFASFFGYGLSGPLFTLWLIRKKRKNRKKVDPSNRG